MAEYPHLSNAPITEALIDIRVELPEAISFDKLGALHEEIEADFPESKTRFVFESQIRLGDHGAQLKTHPSRPDGFLFTSEDKTQVFQARLDGFTFSRLRPYETWEALFEKAAKYWKLYRGVTKPTFNFQGCNALY